MSWITVQQADGFLVDNPDWNSFTNKVELLELATNRLEQLVFKDELIDRVETRYLDGNSLTKVADTDDFLLDPNNGNFAYHEALGWTRARPSMDLHVYTDDGIVNTFIGAEDLNQSYDYTFPLTFKQIQSLHSFGGVFGGTIVKDLIGGTKGNFTSIETVQANAIVGIDGEQVFNNTCCRRLNAGFSHNGTFVVLSKIEGTPKVLFNGTTTYEVINEQDETVINTAPLVEPGKLFTYRFKVVNGLDKTLFLYVNNVLVANPTFSATGSPNGNRLLSSSGSGNSTNRAFYIKQFGATINVENPITIPIRLVGACALLAFEYGKFPPNFVGDKEYLENENDYNRMQDLPINVQAAVEPFLADYESVIVDGIATTTKRGKEPIETSLAKMTDLEYN